MNVGLKMAPLSLQGDTREEVVAEGKAESSGTEQPKKKKSGFFASLVKTFEGSQ